MPSRFNFLVTCEHASADLPEKWRPLLGDYIAARETHEVWDPGTAEIGMRLGRLLDAPVFHGRQTRLLVDLNRSISNPNLFSPPVRELPEQIRTRILLDHYYPFRHEVLRAMEWLQGNRKPLFHISVHSFTPVFQGVKRETDFGILFDPSREWERTISEVWLYCLRAAEPGMSSRANYPYLGVSDGHVTALRRVYRRQPYIGIEIEANQALPLAEDAHRFARLFARTLQRALQTKRVGHTVFSTI